MAVGFTFAFGHTCVLGIRNMFDFVAAFPTAHALAHLRIAGPVTVAVARPIATGSGRLTPGRAAGFPPAGRRTEFHEVIAFFAPFRTA